MRLLKGMGFLFFAAFATGVIANTVTVKLYKVGQSQHGAFIGTVTFIGVKKGLLIKPKLFRLTPGLHGFHIHKNASCAQMGNAAGGHLDPKNTDKHLGPYNPYGHLGDLPVLYVNKTGIADVPTFAPHLKVSDIKGHALMIHAGGDNYSDVPQKLGGGGARVDCGVIQ